MNIFKNKKLIATALTFVLVMTLAYQPLPAKERRGATVEVTMAEGSQIKGELLAVKEDALLVYDQSAHQGKSIDLQQVAQVRILKKSKFEEGFLIGAGIGLGLSALSTVTTRGASKEHTKINYILWPTSLALFGSIFGALDGIGKKFLLAGESPQIVRQNLEQLKRYAREQDYEKSIEVVYAAVISSISKAKAKNPRARQKWHRHRFGLLWSPGRQESSGNIDFLSENGTFRFVNNATSKDTSVYPFKLKFEPVILNCWRPCLLRLEYELTSHFSSSLEFIASGKMSNDVHYMNPHMDLSYYSIDYSGQCESLISMYNEYSYTSLLLGMNWKSFLPSFAHKNIIELGIAAGPALAQVKTVLNAYSSVYNRELNLLQKFKDWTWIYKVHAAYDHFFADNFSLGVFIAYQYLRASFPCVTIFNKQQEFLSRNYYYSQYFIRPTEFTIPGHNIQLGGLAYGIRVGLRF